MSSRPTSFPQASDARVGKMPNTTAGETPALRHSRGRLYYYVLNSFLFATIFRGRQARAEAQFLKSFPRPEGRAPTVRRKRRVNSIAACRAVPHGSPALAHLLCPTSF